MKVLYDTSVLVAAVVAAHPQHKAARPWLEKAHTGQVDGVVCQHSIAELYAVLTTLPVTPRMSARVVRDLIADLLRAVTPVALKPRDYVDVVDELAQAKIAGGVVYDALVARAARGSKASKLLTLNVRDFLRVWPDGARRIPAP